MGIFRIKLYFSEINENTIIENYIVEKLFDYLYYKKYDCDFILCLRKMSSAGTAFFLILKNISFLEKSKNMFFNNHNIIRIHFIYTEKR